jgi:hypothetical protein
MSPSIQRRFAREHRPFFTHKHQAPEGRDPLVAKSSPANRCVPVQHMFAVIGNSSILYLEYMMGILPLRRALS